VEEVAVVEQLWSKAEYYVCSCMRARLKQWSKKIFNLQLLISNCNAVISTLDSVEDQRGLYHPEMNQRIAVKA
jgi:hypothetical protein